MIEMTTKMVHTNKYHVAFGVMTFDLSTRCPYSLNIALKLRILSNTGALGLNPVEAASRNAFSAVHPPKARERKQCGSAHFPESTQAKMGN